MRHFFFLIITTALCLLPQHSYGQADVFNRYIEKYAPMALDQMKRYGVPASITLAQGLVESSAGRSRLATVANNHFGIKCSSSWTGPYILANDDAPNERFRKYGSAAESYEDHSRFLRQNQRYNRLFSLPITDYRSWAYGLKAAGYATAPEYAQTLISIIEDYRLYRYDDKHANNHTVAVIALNHVVNHYNRNYYTIAQEGDTYKSLGKEMGVSARRLRRYNEVDKRAELQPGDIVYFEKKRSKCDKALKGMYHRVAPGESMHRISQMYAVRMATLYKLNGFSPDYAVSVGDLIRLR